MYRSHLASLFFFNDTATTEIYTLSLHDALPISMNEAIRDWVTNVRTTYYCIGSAAGPHPYPVMVRDLLAEDRKSTRLNSSHGYISYAVFCLKKKKINVNINLESIDL